MTVLVVQLSVYGSPATDCSCETITISGDGRAVVTVREIVILLDHYDYSGSPSTDMAVFSELVTSNIYVQRSG